MFSPVLFSLIGKYKKKTFISDLIAGMIVGVVALPLAIAFAIASGVPPEVGLVTAVIGGFLISFFGGSRVQIAGPSGALIVVIYGVMGQFGLEGVALVSLMAGILLILMGLLKAGSIIQFMPLPVTIGFTSGIAFIIFTGQIQEFLGFSGQTVPPHVTGKWMYYLGNLQFIHWPSLGVGLLALVVTVGWPRINRRVPGSLLAIVLTTLLVNILGLPVSTIGNTFGTFGANFHMPSIPFTDWALLQQLITPAFTIAALCAMESLMSAMVADGATGYRHRPNTELMAHGIANIFSPLFGGMAASGALAKTMTNIRNGGKTPVAGLIHSLVLLAFLVFLGKLAKMIPMASLSAVLMVVAYNMSEWRSFRNILKSSKSEMSVLLTTFLLTIIMGLNVAVPVGVILALVLFVKRVMETSGIEVLKEEVDSERAHMGDMEESLEVPQGVEVFQIKGPFFFGVANKFVQAEQEIREHPRLRILRMRRVPFIDSTGIRNLRSFIERSQAHGIGIILSGVPPKTMEALVKEGLHHRIGEENICENIESSLARARELLAAS